MRRGMVAILACVGLFNTVDVFTVMDDVPGIGLLKPAVWNATSLIAFGPAAWIIWRAYRAARPGSAPLWRLALAHGAGAVAMALVHVTLFTLLRQAVFAALGQSYGFGPLAEFPYEFRKDLLGYGLGVAIYWTVERLHAPPPPAPSAERPAPPGAPAPAAFDIRDGARVIRAPVDQILAVTSAGNYVEFVLADGRRPLMRAPLSRLEAELAPHGLLRTHRSWLVNAARVSELRPESSGDYRVIVGGVEAPVSRRFRAALARLKAGTA